MANNKKNYTDGFAVYSQLELMKNTEWWSIFQYFRYFGYRSENRLGIPNFGVCFSGFGNFGIEFFRISGSRTSVFPGILDQNFYPNLQWEKNCAIEREKLEA